MGAWGYGIRQDDFVLDVVGVFEDGLKSGLSVASATEAVQAKFTAAIDDDVDGPLLWIALADVQWSYGELDPGILERVRVDLASGRSLEPWRDDPRGLARRAAALQAFLGKIAAPNPRPKKRPKVVVRAPKFQAGDCLAIRVSNGHYAAALVLAADDSLPEYGRNLVGLLDYLSPERPPIDLFRRRQWLAVTHGTGDTDVAIAWYLPIGFRATKARLEVVGRIEILESDPTDSRSHRRWTAIGEEAIAHAR
jgi:hypothetical protein